MANIDFKNIKFAYVKVVNGYPSIDASMTDRIFKTTKPTGYYHCFIFPKAYFSGVDHEDLRNLVSIEKSNIWDETLRSTLLGYNAVSNEFILNLNAYYGLKDSNLKTDGNLKYSGQASWQVMTLSTTQQSDSIVTLKQTNETNAYLSIKPITVDNAGSKTKVYPPLSVEVEKKSIRNATLLTKDDMLWAKSPEDGVPIMVNNCIKSITTKTGKLIVPLDDNKKYGYVENAKGVNYEYYVKTMRFGKELVYFDSTATTEKSSLLSFYPSVKVVNSTGVSSVEYTDTSLLSDILSSGESLVFQLTKKDKYVWGYQTKSTYNEDYPNLIIYDDDPVSSSTDAITGVENNTIELTEFVDKNIIGYEYGLVSCDTRKPFFLNTSDRIYGVSVGFTSDFDITKIFESLPDGYVALMLGSVLSQVPNQSIIRWKKGDPVKAKTYDSSDRRTSYVNINGATSFGNTIYGVAGTEANKPTGVPVELNDVINGAGFTNLTSQDTISSYKTFGLVTILRV